jgi:hypothetical protein
VEDHRNTACQFSFDGIVSLKSLKIHEEVVYRIGDGRNLHATCDEDRKATKISGPTFINELSDKDMDVGRQAVSSLVQTCTTLMSSKGIFQGEV